MHKFWASLGYKMETCLRGKEGKRQEGGGWGRGTEGRGGGKKEREKEREMQRGKKRQEGGRESPFPILQTGFHHITSSSELKT